MSDRLSSAAARLEAFAQHAIKKQKGSTLSKTVHLMRKLLNRVLRRSSEKAKTELLKAIETINTHRIDIRSLQLPLANSIRSSIDTYNQSLKHTKMMGRAVPLPAIHLPRIVMPIVRYFPGAQAPHQATTPMISQAAFNTRLPEQTADLFRMKVLSLLNRYEIATNPQARFAVKKTPIATLAHASDRFCLLTQTVKLFPWETVTIQGTSELDPSTQTINRLLPETFSVSLVTEQTAYPHPCQRVGWTLAEQLISEAPQRLDLLDAHAALFITRKEMLEQLVSGKTVTQVAKHLFRIKQRVFQNDLSDFIALHEQLAQTVIAASGSSAISHVNRCKAFFVQVKQDPSAFEFLGETSHQIRELWMARPYHSVVDAPLSEVQRHHRPSIEALFQAAQIQVEVEIMQRIEEASSDALRMQWEWILHYGALIGKASISIMLQHLSEDFGFEPPPLTLFQTQLQTIAFNHLADYLAELNHPEFDEAKQVAIMKAQMAIDRSCFQTNSPSPLSQDLAAYFRLRHHTLSK